MGTNNDESTISMMKERNEQTLADIQNLQKIEKELYTTLESGVNNLTAEQKQKIVGLLRHDQAWKNNNNKTTHVRKS